MLILSIRTPKEGHNFIGVREPQQRMPLLVCASPIHCHMTCTGKTVISVVLLDVAFQELSYAGVVQEERACEEYEKS